MFGYVIMNRATLKENDILEYQSFYCGLCHMLKEEFGLSSQMTLNNDMTFLAILLSSLYEPKTETFDSRCVLHPVHKRKKKRNECLRYCAMMTIVLSYFKCQDDWLDEHQYDKKLYMKMLEKHFRRIEKLYPKKIANIQMYLQKIHEIENKEDYSLDEISLYSGKMMGEICAYQDDMWHDDLYQFGVYLGKFIYFMDAYDDYEQDMKKGCYNPLHKIFQKKDYEEKIYDILELMIAKATEIFEYLPVIENVEILRNILYSGVWSKYSIVRKRREEKE